jgi:Cytochrome b
MIPSAPDFSVNTQDSSAQGIATIRRKVWDVPVRIFHWLLVLSFAGAYLTNWLGISWFQYHEWFGYAVTVLVTFRILWGFFGTWYARFANFVRSPIVTWHYTINLLRGKETTTAGHNPLGALMVLFFLVALLIQAVSGLFANDEIFNAGALYGYVSNETSLQLTALHKELFYWIFAATVLHVLAVLFHVFLKNENLISAMITGYKTGGEPLRSAPSIDSSLWIRATILLALVSVTLYLLISFAPSASLDLDY